MNPNDFFTIDNPQGAFILSGTAADLFQKLARDGAPETQLVFGVITTDERGARFPSVTVNAAG